MRPPTLCVSRVAGLREAFEARALTGAWLQWHDATTADESALRQSLATCEVLIGEPAECAPLVEHCPKLAWLQSTFAGCNPLLKTSRRDYVATRLAGCFGPDMSEYTALHVLALERKYDEQRDNQRRGAWVAARDATGVRQGGADYRRLSSLTLGVLGLGDIGTCIAGTLHHGLRMRVVGWRRDASPRASDASAGVSHVFGGLAELPSFLAQSDYIVSVLPSTPDTAGLLDGDALAPCAARSAALINVGRGDLLSPEAIVRALDAGWLRHYVGDVFAPEPLAAGSPLWAHPKVTVTPHNSAVTAPEDVAGAFADNLARYESGGAAALRHVFDWGSGY